MLGSALKAAGIVTSWIGPVSTLITLIARRRWREVQKQAIVMANRAEREAFEQEMGIRG